MTFLHNFSKSSSCRVFGFEPTLAGICRDLAALSIRVESCSIGKAECLTKDLFWLSQDVSPVFVVTSQNVVACLLQAFSAKEKWIEEIVSTAKFYAIGEQTAAKLQSLGCKHIEYPENAGHQGLLGLLRTLHTGKIYALVGDEVHPALQKYFLATSSIQIVPIYRCVFTKPFFSSQIAQQPTHLVCTSTRVLRYVLENGLCEPHKSHVLIFSPTAQTIAAQANFSTITYGIIRRSMAQVIAEWLV